MLKLIPDEVVDFKEGGKKVNLDQESFVVERILNHHLGKDNSYSYLVKWKGYSKNHNSWEPVSNFNSLLPINKYWKLKKKKNLKGRNVK
jgi:chromobox protein 5